MSISNFGIDVSTGSADSLHVPNGEGMTKRFAGDVSTVHLQAGRTADASVSSGGGPVPHTHADQDE